MDLDPVTHYRAVTLPSVEVPLIQLDAHCAVCTEKIDEDVLVTALIGERARMTYLGRTIKFPFPIHGTYYPSPGGIDAYLDRKTSVHLCFLCTNSTSWKNCISDHPSHALKPYEAVTAHHDCFSMFIQSCPGAPRLACERLWKLAIARCPWPVGFQDLPAISLTGAYIVCPEAVRKVASIYNLRHFSNFPTELVERIRSYGEGNAIFWRAVAALTVASSLSNFPAHDEQRVHLTQVSHWERGGTIQTSGPEARPDDVLRITFDIDGVRKIERLPQWPSCERQQKTDERFAWTILPIDGDEIAHTNKSAYCQNGLLRFSFDHGNRGHYCLPRIWDTPTPPDLYSIEHNADEFYFPGGIYGAFEAGHLINFDSISGLTFVYEGKQLTAIRSHRGDQINNFGIPDGSRYGDYGQYQACFFLPVSEEDKIMAIGIGSYSRALVILVKKRLSGDAVIGLPCPTRLQDVTDFDFGDTPDDLLEGPGQGDEDFFDQRDFHWGAREPQALLYGFSGKANRLDLLGGYRYDPPEKWVSGFEEVSERSIPHRWPRIPLFSRDNQKDLGYYTSAPLEGVVAVQMFHSRKWVPRGGERFCSGIILHYENGGSRVVGEVRLIKDRASIVGETILHPKLICLEFPDYGTSDTQRIHFLAEADIEKGVHPVDTDCLIGCPRFPIAESSICYPMEGTIDWWFTASERMRVEIRKPEEEEEGEEEEEAQEEDTDD